MKSYNEIAENILSRRNEYEEVQRIKRKKILRTSSFAGSIILIAVLCAGVWQSGHMKQNYLPNAVATSQKESHTETATADMHGHMTESATEQTTRQKDEASSVYENGDTGGDITGGWCIPALPFDKEIELTGEEITDAEAKEYFDKNKDIIIGALSSSGVPSDSIKISDSGYCHVAYNGEEGKPFEIRQNSRDYTVYNGDELVAIITLYKENGEIFNTPAFGANWFVDYGNFLRKHKGERLVYAYAGWFEIIIAPDNTCYNLMGLDVSPYLEGAEKPYEMFYHEKAVYIP